MISTSFEPRGRKSQIVPHVNIITPLVIYTSEDLKPHPFGGAMVQTVTGNLLEISSAMRIEIFKGVKRIIFLLNIFETRVGR